MFPVDVDVAHGIQDAERDDMGWREPGRKAADDYDPGWPAERAIPELAGRCCAV